MAKLDTNWDIVKQRIIDDVSSVIKDFTRLAVLDIENRLKEKGLDPTKMSKSKNRISFITDDIQEFETGRAYFEEVEKEISAKNWPESVV